MMYVIPQILSFFFFSSRRRHTRWTGDWSSACALPISDRCDNVVIDGNLRPNDTEKLCEADRDSRNGAGLNNEEKCPAVEKTPKRRERFAQINILPAGLRHHRGQLAVRERRRQSQQASDDPDNQQPSGRAYLPRNVRGDDENAGADH